MLTLGLLLALPAPAEPLRVLFVGNSYTDSFGGLGELVEVLARSRPSSPEVAAEQVAPPGFTLEQHFEDPTGSRGPVAGGGWDQVVLQEQSLRPVLDRAAFERWGRLLVAEARSAGAEPMLFLTWAWASRPDDQPLLVEAYCELATELGVEVAPVGLAFELARMRRPGLELHAADGSHPAPTGAYLAALVLWATLTGESPEGAPAKLTLDVDLAEPDAAFLQRVVVDTLAGVRADGRPGSGACAFGAAGELLLSGGRFAVTVDLTDPFGGERAAHAVPIRDDTGAFWFFDPANLELLVKVLDGRSVNGHFWVFFGALSNVAYTVTVTDRLEGRSRVYENPRGTLASRADVRAFPAVQ